VSDGCFRASGKEYGACLSVIYVDIPGTTTDGVFLLPRRFFAIGLATASVGLASDLAGEARMPVVIVDYRLPPETPTPPPRTIPWPPTRACSTAVRTSPASRSPGESAGANLAMVTPGGHRTRRPGQPAAAALI
jgi:hypothetical protein